MKYDYSGSAYELHRSAAAAGVFSASVCQGVPSCFSSKRRAQRGDGSVTRTEFSSVSRIRRVKRCVHRGGTEERRIARKGEERRGYRALGGLRKEKKEEEERNDTR